MKWYDLVSAIIAGLIAVGLTHFILKNRPYKRSSQRWVSIIIWVVVFALLRQLLVPFLIMYENKRTADGALQKTSAFRALKQYAPQRYEGFLVEITDGFTANRTESWYVNKIANYALKISEEFLPRASDESVIRFLRASYNTIVEMEKLNPELGYYCLFVPESLSTVISSPLPQQTLDSGMYALADIVKSASENPKEIPIKPGALDDLEVIRHKIFKLYGDDISLLNSGLIENTEDRLKVCLITKHLFNLILELPQENAASVARHIYGMP